MPRSSITQWTMCGISLSPLSSIPCVSIFYLPILPNLVLSSTRSATCPKTRWTMWSTPLGWLMAVSACGLVRWSRCGKFEIRVPPNRFNASTLTLFQFVPSGLLEALNDKSNAAKGKPRGWTWEKTVQLLVKTKFDKRSSWTHKNVADWYIE